MKKLAAVIFVLICVLGIVGCHHDKQETLTYSFRGEHEYFTISNGSIVFNDAEEVFEGGKLEIVQPEPFADVASYSTTFYTMKNGERNVIMSNSIIDKTGGTVNINGDFGRVGGTNLFGMANREVDNLWFELKTTDLNGAENVYQIQLVLTE